MITYTPSLGRTIARAARRARIGRFHLMPSMASQGKWALVSEGSTRTMKVFTTKNAAVSFVRKFDSGEKMNYVVIHNRDGRIYDTVSFAHA